MIIKDLKGYIEILQEVNKVDVSHLTSNEIKNLKTLLLQKGYKTQLYVSDREYLRLIS